MSVDVTTLDNGLRIVTERNPAVETASLGLWIDAGSRIEAEASGGIAHMLEHMVFKGTSSRSAQAIATEIEDVGGHLNAYTGREQTGYYAKVLKDDVALAIDLTSDLVFAAELDAEELERERAVILQEIGQANDTPDDIIFDHLQAVAYPRQGLGRPVLGTPETVSAIPRADLAAFRDAWYRPSRMVFAAAGNLEHARIVDEVARRVADRSRPAAEAASATMAPASYVGGVYGESRDLEQTHLVAAYPGAAFADPGVYALSVYATLVGGGMSSRLFQEVRERRGLCYAISAWSGSLVDGGSFGIYTGTGPEAVVELVPVLAEELRRASIAAPFDEIARARAQIRAGLLMGLESTSSRMDALGSQILTYGRPLPTEEIVARVNAVDGEHIARVARRIFSGAPTMAAIGPISRLEMLAKIRARLD